MNATGRPLLLVQALLFAAASALSLAVSAQAVKLTVGYQPYDTISYSAVVIRGLELWKKHLPPGSSVDFESALQGAIIVNAMLADKQQIGYLGDMPAVVSTTKPKQANIKLVASTGLSAGQRCNVIMVRADAPPFKSAEEAVKWLDGKVARHAAGELRGPFPEAGHRDDRDQAEGSSQSVDRGDRDQLPCEADRCGGAVGALGLAHRRLRGRRHRARGYHGPLVQHARRRVHRYARGFREMRPDIVKAWLKAELEAQQFILDPKNWEKVADPRPQPDRGDHNPDGLVLHLRRRCRPERGGSPIRDEKPFTFDDARPEAPDDHLYVSSSQAQGDRCRQSAGRV